MGGEGLENSNQCILRNNFHTLFKSQSNIVLDSFLQSSSCILIPCFNAVTSRSELSGSFKWIKHFAQLIEEKIFLLDAFIVGYLNKGHSRTSNGDIDNNIIRKLIVLMKFSEINKWGWGVWIKLGMLKKNSKTNNWGAGHSSVLKSTWQTFLIKSPSPANN